MGLIYSLCDNLRSMLFFFLENFSPNFLLYLPTSSLHFPFISLFKTYTSYKNVANAFEDVRKMVQFLTLELIPVYSLVWILQEVLTRLSLLFAFMPFPYSSQELCWSTVEVNSLIYLTQVLKNCSLSFYVSKRWQHVNWV